MPDPVKGPKDRSSHRILRQHAGQAGFAAEVLEELLWSINAHVGLIAFPQICQNIDDILEQIPLHWGTPLAHWKLEDWPSLLRWIVNDRQSLSKAISGGFDRCPKKDNCNPILGSGGGSFYPLYTALWNTHDDPARRESYLLLQGHLLVAHNEAMRQHCSRLLYETGVHGREWQPLPNSTYDFGLALRHMSSGLSVWTAYLDRLPVGDPPEVFAGKLKSLQTGLGTSLERHHTALRLFLGKVFAGRPWIHRAPLPGPRRARQHRLWVKGYTPVSSQATRQKSPVGDRDDPDFVWGEQDYVRRCHAKETLQNELLAVDDYAGEDEDIPLLLSTYAEIAAGEDPGNFVAASQAQVNHVQMAHQLLPWAYSTLGMQELRHFLGKSSEWVRQFAKRGPSAPNDAKRLEVVALAHVLLATGSSLERALTLQVIPPGVEQRQADFALLLAPGSTGDQQPAADTWNARALVPAYRTERSSPQERTRDPFLALPDATQSSFSLRVLLAYEAQGQKELANVPSGLNGPQAMRPFRRPAEWYMKMLRRELPRYDVTGRLTATKLSGWLFSRLIQQSGGDIAAAALITGQPHPLAQVRLYYATPACRDLQEAYVRAASLLGTGEPAENGPKTSAAQSLRWAPPELHIGSRLCPTRQSVKEAVHALIEAVGAARRASDQAGFLRYHNLYTLFSIWSFAYATGVRGIRTPYLYASEIDSTTGIGQLTDKDSGSGYKTRLLWAPPAILTQMQYYRDHLAAVRSQIGASGEAALEPCFFLDRHQQPLQVRPKTLQPVMQEFLDFPVNMHRRFLRSELFASGCAPEVIDAWMGHWHYGEEPWGPYSSFSYAESRRELAHHLVPILEDLGFRPLGSRLASGMPFREGETPVAVRPAAQTAAITGPAKVPGIPDEPLSPALPDSRCWDPAALGLSEAQKTLLPEVWGWLTKQEDPAAQILSGRSRTPYTAEQGTAFETAVLRHFAPLAKTAECLRILGKAVALRNEVESIALPALRIPHQPLRPVNPFHDNAALALERVRRWRTVLDGWVRESAYSSSAESPSVTLSSVLLSAVLHGGLLHRTSLVALVRVLALRPESIQRFTDQVHVDLSLSWRGEADMEQRRWYPDALSASLLLRLAPEPVRELLFAGLAPGEEQAARNLPEKLLRKLIWQHLSQALQRSGLRKGERPRNLADLVDTVKLATATELPSLLVAYATRQWVSHALKPAVLARLCAQPVPRNEAPAQVKEGFPRVADKKERLRSGSGDDLTDLAPAWLKALRQAFESADRSQARQALHSLRAQAADWPPAGNCMREFADFLLAKNAGTGYPVPFAQDRARVLRVAKRLGCLVGGNDIAALSIDALEALYTQVLEDAGQSDKTGCRRGKMALALRAFHHFLVAVHGVPSLQSRDLLRMGPGLLPVDCTVLTHEEYGQILHKIDTIDRDGPIPLHLDIKRIAKLLVVLGFRCGLRRREALQLKSRDLCENDPAELLIRPSAMRTLKTPNATRKLPLSILLTAEELTWLREWKYDREAQLHTQQDQYLFGIPELNFDFVPEDTLLPLIHRAMRETTQDFAVRFHHLRHSFATWTFLRLMLSDLKEIPALLPHLPQTTAWLQKAREFRCALYGHSFHTRKHAYAVTLLLGHSAPDVSLEHYVHCLDWLLAIYLKASPALAPPEALVALASGRPSTTAYRWLEKGGPDIISARLYNARFPERLSSLRTAASLPATSAAVGLSEDSWVWPIWKSLYRHETERVPLLDLVEESTVPLAGWERMLSQAQALRDMRVPGVHTGYRHRMVQFLRDRRSPEKRERLSCPVYPHLATDREPVRALAPRLLALMESDPSLAGRVLDDYVHRIRPRENLLRFPSPRRAAEARDYLAFLSALGILRDRLRFVSFDTAERSRWIPQWREALGLTWRHPIEKRPPPKNNGARAASWLAIEPVLTPSGEDAPNNATGSYGFRFLLLMAAIAWAGKGASANPGKSQGRAEPGPSLIDAA